MANEEFQEKSEKATPRKLDKAKKKGQVAKSKDLSSMAAMGGILLLFYFGGGIYFNKMSEMTGGILSMKFGSNPIDVAKIAAAYGLELMLPVLITSVVLFTATDIAQGGFIFKSIEFKFDSLNPVNGLKKIISIKGLAEFLKSIIKFAVGAWVVYYIIQKDLKVLPALAAMEIPELVKVSAKLVFSAIAIAFFYYLLTAIVSYFLEKWQFERSMRMTKQEVKEEGKEVEGDPLIKSRIRSVQRETAKKRMMKEVPEATVVITNPTHLAIALKYEDQKMFAPKIVAKGAGIVAEKIKEIASEHGVPIVEDKPLARALFRLDLESFIPEELYVAVAKVLAYIYRLKGKV
jgi:flagellar biosynthetic protein FlhB